MPAPQRLALWQRALGLATPTLVVTMLLLAAEAGLRLTLPRVDGIEVFVRSPRQRFDLVDRREVRILEGDPLLLWRVRPNLDRVVWDYTPVSTTAQGIRRCRPLGPKSSSGTRIMCLGDSVTFGFRVPLVFPENPESYDREAGPYPELLERRLAAANPGRAIEVLNLAVPGYTSRQGLAQLGSAVERLAPDVVIIAFGWNDVSLREEADKDAMPMGGASVLARRIVGSSQLLLRATLLCQRALYRRNSPSVAARPVPRVSQEDFVSNVLACARLAGRHGARCVIVAPILGGSLQAGPEEKSIGEYRRALRTAAEQARLPFLEVRALTEAGFPDNGQLFPVEPIHPGERGHVVLAEALLRFLEEEKILAGLGLVGTPGAGRVS